MFSHLQVSSPIAFFDLHTTGLSTSDSRIIEWAVLRIDPGSDPVLTSKRCKPDIPIPLEASGIHGIYDADVSELSGFSEQAEEIVRLLYGCTVSGFNILRYDIPLLNSELDRANYPVVRIPYRPALDVMQVFHSYCPRVRGRRNLSLAHELYVGGAHVDAHGAAADVMASAKVLDAMIGRHSLPRELELLSKKWN